MELLLKNCQQELDRIEARLRLTAAARKKLVLLAARENPSVN